MSCCVSSFCIPLFLSENFGGPILFQWIERIKELLQSWETETKNEKLETTMDNSLKQEAMTSEISCSLKLTHGPLIQDRKSVFQGHACKVTTPEEIKCVSILELPYIFITILSVGTL